jgi:hypothetical protein
MWTFIHESPIFSWSSRWRSDTITTEPYYATMPHVGRTPVEVVPFGLMWVWLATLPHPYKPLLLWAGTLPHRQVTFYPSPKSCVDIFPAPVRPTPSLVIFYYFDFKRMINRMAKWFTWQGKYRHPRQPFLPHRTPHWQEGKLACYPPY